MIPFLKSSTKSDNEIKVHMSPWDPGMAPERQPCNMTYTTEQTPALPRMLTQGSPVQLHPARESGAVACSLPSFLISCKSHRGWGLCFGGCRLWNVPRSHGLVGCKFLGTLHMLFECLLYFSCANCYCLKLSEGRSVQTWTPCREESIRRPCSLSGQAGRGALQK